jgi:hypothetical protein
MSPQNAKQKITLHSAVDKVAQNGRRIFCTAEEASNSLCCLVAHFNALCALKKNTIIGEGLYELYRPDADRMSIGDAH